MTENETAKEQIRGLYIVGLLAVLITIKLTVKTTDPFTDLFLLYLISSWAIYSFCMIFAYSDMPKVVVAFFKEFAWIFLWFSLAASFAYFVVISYTMFILAPFTILVYVLFGVAMILVYYGKKKGRARIK